MKVTCSRCGTEYNFDDSKVTEEGVKVKCTRCENVFRVRKKAYAITEPVQAGGPPPVTAAPVAEDTTSTTYSGATPRQWMIRRSSGETLDFKEMTTLQRWIVERRVAPGDEISHNGVKWKRLGAIPELGPFFKVVEDEDADAAARAATTSDPRTSTGEFLRAQEEDPPGRRAESPPPSAMNAWGDDRPTNKPRDPSTSERAVEAGARGASASTAGGTERRRTRRGFVWLGMAVLAGGGAYWAQFTPEGLAATAPARTWLLANTGLDLGGSLPDATPTAVAAVTPTPDETPVAPVSPIPAESPTPQPTATDVVIATPAPTPAPTRVAVVYDVDTLLQQGYEAYSRGKYRDAIRKYQAAVNAAPDNSEAYALLGLAYLDSGNDDLAESSLEAAIRLNPRFADAHRYLGMLYARRSDKARAVTAFKKYLDLRPNGPTSDDVRRRVASLEGG